MGKVMRNPCLSKPPLIRIHYPGTVHICNNPLTLTATVMRKYDEIRQLLIRIALNKVKRLKNNRIQDASNKMLLRRSL